MTPAPSPLVSAARRGLLPLLAAALAMGCGAGSQDGRIQMEPPVAVTKVGVQLPLSVRLAPEVAGDPEWEVEELHGGGLLRSQGLRTTYVPPAVAGTYHVVLHARLASGGTLKRTFTVNVLPDPVVRPSTANLPQGATLAFTAHMHGLGRQGVTWSVLAEDGGDAGSITDQGLFTAPLRQAEVLVRATSTQDPSVTAEAVVAVGR